MSAIHELLVQVRTRGSPALMGVVNVTPDSFSDGGVYASPDRARALVDRLIAEGAEIIDVGGESTRPQFQPVDVEEQIRRTIPVVSHAVDAGAIVSIDTTDAPVARAALDAGAKIINDVSCLRNNGAALAREAARADAWLIVMHARQRMTQASGYKPVADDAYQDVVDDVRREWLEALEIACDSGVPRDRVWFDPGLGFNKNAKHSAELVARLEAFHSLNTTVVVGPSRKSFLVADVPADPLRRVGGTAAASIACALKGAHILRVHDVLEVRQALAVSRRIGLLTTPPTVEVHRA